MGKGLLPAAPDARGARALGSALWMRQEAPRSAEGCRPGHFYDGCGGEGFGHGGAGVEGGKEGVLLVDEEVGPTHLAVVLRPRSLAGSPPGSGRSSSQSVAGITAQGLSAPPRGAREGRDVGVPPTPGGETPPFQLRRSAALPNLQVQRKDSGTMEPNHRANLLSRHGQRTWDREAEWSTTRDPPFMAYTTPRSRCAM